MTQYVLIDDLTFTNRQQNSFQDKTQKKSNHVGFEIYKVLRDI